MYSVFKGTLKLSSSEVASIVGSESLWNTLLLNTLSLIKYLVS